MLMLMLMLMLILMLMLVVSTARLHRSFLQHPGSRFDSIICRDLLVFHMPAPC